MGQVPGTFKNRPGSLVRDRSLRGIQAENAVRQVGSLSATAYALGQCSVMVSLDPVGPNGEGRWHLSIAHPSRYPTWDEIKAARYLAPELDDVLMMAQLLPKLDNNDQWVNLHENTFHLNEIREDL